MVGGSPSDFRVAIQTFGGLGRIALLSASIPNTLYNVYEVNDMLYWTRAATPYSVAIPHGAYGVTALVAMLTSLMNGVDAGGLYNVAYSTVTMKLTFASTDTSFSLTVATRTLAAWDILGFQSSTPLTPGITQVADSVIRLDFPSHLYLDIGLPGADVVNTRWVHTNYIIPMSGISQYVEVCNRAATFDQLQPYTLQSGVSSLHVRLMRPDGSLAELNGGEYSFVLGFECPEDAKCSC